VSEIDSMTMSAPTTRQTLPWATQGKQGLLESSRQVNEWNRPVDVEKGLLGSGRWWGVGATKWRRVSCAGWRL